jgi:serine/threonine-protein kinase
MFGRYELQELLGRGGMGEVYRALDTERDRTVAVKLLPKHLASDDSFKSRFRRESRMAAKLNDPHIIPIHDFGEIDGTLFIDMRLVEGKDLTAVLSEGGALSPEQAVKIISQASSALHAAHEAGLVHRDVKPSNILLSRWVRGEDSDPFAYLVDFGIARAANQEGTALTATSGTVGTVAYMSPERIGGEPGDRRTDIYALGAVLYEALTGKKPFDGEIFAIMYAHMNTPPPKVSAHLPGPLGHALDVVIEKAMAKNPDDRYPTALEFATAARKALRAPGGGAPTDEDPDQTVRTGLTPPTPTGPTSYVFGPTGYQTGPTPYVTAPAPFPTGPTPYVTQAPVPMPQYIAAPVQPPPQQPVPPGPVRKSGMSTKKKVLFGGGAVAAAVVAGLVTALAVGGGGGSADPTDSPAAQGWSNFSAFNSLVGTRDGDPAAFRGASCTYVNGKEPNDPDGVIDQVKCTYPNQVVLYVVRADPAKLKQFLEDNTNVVLNPTPIQADGVQVGTKYTSPVVLDQPFVMGVYCALPDFIVQFGSNDGTQVSLSALDRDYWTPADVTSHVPHQKC